MLFSSLIFYAAQDVSQKIIELCKANGGSHYNYLGEFINVVLCDDPSCGEYVEARGLFNLPVVSAKWVQLSLLCSQLLSYQSLLVDENNIFHGLNVTASHVGQDRDKLWALLTFNGAKTSSLLSNQSTHLVTCSSTHKAPHGVHVVTPDWVMDSVRASRRMNEEDYNPALLQSGVFNGLVFYGDNLDLITSQIESRGASVCRICLDCATHVVVQSQDQLICKRALSQRKRIVTLTWLKDCAYLGAVIPPWKALHFPVPFANYQPCCGQTITTTGFSKQERRWIVYMIKLMGGTYTDSLTGNNSVLIFNTLSSEKIDKARIADIAVVSPLWLSDLMLGNLEALKLPVKVKYKSKLDNIFEFTSSLVQNLMVGWNQRIAVPRPVSRSTHRAIEKIVITVTGVEESKINKIKNLATSLGAVVLPETGQCSHIVADRLGRSLKFLCAINHCSYVVTSKWIEDSAQSGYFLAEDSYLLRDIKSEQKLGCSLVDILSRVSHGKLFSGLCFHVTPNVDPNVRALRLIILSAGGLYLQELPTQFGEGLIIVTCDRDINLLSNLIRVGMRVYSPEVVLSCVFAQRLMFDKYVLQL